MRTLIALTAAAVLVLPLTANAKDAGGSRSSSTATHSVQNDASGKIRPVVSGKTTDLGKRLVIKVPTEPKHVPGWPCPQLTC